MASGPPYFFFRVAFFLATFFLATFFFGAAFFLVAFFLATFFLATFFLATFFLATFFLATFFLATFFLGAAFFLVAFFLATVRPPNKVAGELLADCGAGGRKSADLSPQKQDNESVYTSHHDNRLASQRVEVLVGRKRESETESLVSVNKCFRVVRISE